MPPANDGFIGQCVNVIDTLSHHNFTSGSFRGTEGHEIEVKLILFCEWLAETA